MKPVPEDAGEVPFCSGCGDPWEASHAASCGGTERLWTDAFAKLLGLHPQSLRKMLSAARAGAAAGVRRAADVPLPEMREREVMVGRPPHRAVISAPSWTREQAEEFAANRPGIGHGTRWDGKDVLPCGTRAGAARHRRAAAKAGRPVAEFMCAPCKEAERVDAARRQGRDPDGDGGE